MVTSDHGTGQRLNRNVVGNRWACDFWYIYRCAAQYKYKDRE